MDEGTESLEKETGEIKSSKIEVVDGRGEVRSPIGCPRTVLASLAVPDG